MNKAHRIHRQKVQRRVRDLKAQARGRRIPETFCLAKCVGRAVLEAPLNLSRIEVPTTYEDED